MGVQISRKVEFTEDVPSNDAILRRLLELSELKVKLSIDHIQTVEEMTQILKQAGLKVKDTLRERVVYLLEHSDHTPINYWLGVDQNEKNIVFRSEDHQDSSLLVVFQAALISLGGKETK